MTDYRIHAIYDGRQYIATVDEFPGVRGYGDTKEEAMEAAKVGLQETIASYQRAGVALPEANEI